MRVSDENKSLLFNLSTKWDKTDGKRIGSILFDSFENIYRTNHSYGINYAWVAAGRFDGVYSLCKDSFPAFAGSILIQEAGGIFTNLDGDSDIKASDRVFIGGNKEVYDKIGVILNNS